MLTQNLFIDAQAALLQALDLLSAQDVITHFADAAVRHLVDWDEKCTDEPLLIAQVMARWPLYTNWLRADSPLGA